MSPNAATDTTNPSTATGMKRPDEVSTDERDQESVGGLTPGIAPLAHEPAQNRCPETGRFVCIAQARKQEEEQDRATAPRDDAHRARHAA